MAKKRTTQTTEEASVTESTEAVAVAEPGPIERARAAACRARDDARDLALAADYILRKWGSRIAEVKASGYDLAMIPAEDIAVLQAAGIPTDHNGLLQQLARGRRVVGFLNQAGTVTQREADRVAFEEATERENRRRPELEKVIRDAEEELEHLELATAKARDAHEARVTAYQMLQQDAILPEYAVRQRRNSPEAMRARELKSRIINLRSQVNGIEQLGNLSGLGRVDHFRHNGMEREIRVQPKGPGVGLDYVSDAVWAEYCAKRNVEADRLRGDIAKLERERDALMQATSTSDWYTRLCDAPAASADAA